MHEIHEIFFESLIYAISAISKFQAHDSDKNDDGAGASFDAAQSSILTFSCTCRCQWWVVDRNFTVGDNLEGHTSFTTLMYVFENRVPVLQIPYELSPLFSLEKVNNNKGLKQYGPGITAVMVHLILPSWCIQPGIDRINLRGDSIQMKFRALFQKLKISHSHTNGQSSRPLL